ncbi:hypothetical protein FVE85_6864 [Porphyridium purpureum]|uniref:Small ribosomal subunit protein mS33 n=1 Tax=Porphyridium purpureum TaxID=35688 RepID=A0A5J4Z5F1_PORPP|nr:hypothetical protein FVE85_6864 [Porphyridium purpureum]|eukprot:POR9262..scf295_1
MRSFKSASLFGLSNGLSAGPGGGAVRRTFVSHARVACFTSGGEKDASHGNAAADGNAQMVAGGADDLSAQGPGAAAMLRVDWVRQVMEQEIEPVADERVARDLRTGRLTVASETSPTEEDQIQIQNTREFYIDTLLAERFASKGCLSTGRSLHDIQCDIHGWNRNPTGQRNGRRILRKRLIGQEVVDWYIPRIFRQPGSPIKMNAVEQYRQLRHIARRKAGKGPPAKGEGKRSKIAAGKKKK